MNFDQTAPKESNLGSYCLHNRLSNNIADDKRRDWRERVKLQF